MSAAVLLALFAAAATTHADTSVGRARIVCTMEITGGELPVAGGFIPVGGISDLYLEAETSAAKRRLWAVTDRGPNGVVSVEERGSVEKRRTVLAPEFAPSLVLLDASWIGDAHAQREKGSVAVERIVPLKARSGRPLSGRPNGLKHDERGYTADASAAVATDPDGVDTEGVVAVGADGFWLVEEYRPSILRVSADGTVMSRHVPAGDALPGAAAGIVANLPARYARRAKNRGFEAIAITPDRRRVFALMQSPLERCAGGSSSPGRVPLLVFDAATCRPVAEHEYQLAKPEVDGKLCAMACIGPSSLLVIEQADGGLARLYRIEVPGEPSLPLTKTLVADLKPLTPAMVKDVHGSHANSASLKIEGLAIVDERHVLLANDNDFGVADAGAKAKKPPRSCLWLIELSAPLPLEPRT